MKKLKISKSFRNHSGSFPRLQEIILNGAKHSLKKLGVEKKAVQIRSRVLSGKFERFSPSKLISSGKPDIFIEIENSNNSNVVERRFPESFSSFDGV